MQNLVLHHLMTYIQNIFSGQSHIARIKCALCSGSWEAMLGKFSVQSSSEKGSNQTRYSNKLYDFEMLFPLSCWKIVYNLGVCYEMQQLFLGVPFTYIFFYHKTLVCSPNILPFCN